MKISPTTSVKLKGIAILMMVAHHVLGFPYQMHFFSPSMVTTIHPMLEQLIGTFGKVCVPMYLMLSGYGFGAQGRTSLSYYADKVVRILAAYWFYFAIFVPIGLVWYSDVPFFFGDGLRYDPSPSRILLDAFVITHRYNEAWWFLQPYLILTLLSGILVRGMARHPGLTLIGSTLLFGFSLRLFPDSSHMPQGSVYGVLFWQFPFVFGLFLQKLGDLGWRRLDSRLNRIALIVYLAVAFIGLGHHLRMTWQIWICAPFLLLAIKALEWFPQTDRAWVLFGRNSLPIWLVHAFLCYYYWQPQFTALRYSFLVFAAVFAASLGVSMAGEKARALITAWLWSRVPFLGRTFARQSRTGA